MFKNHLKIAWRNLKTNRLFSIINILGLSLGIAITLVLFVFISNERSFDQFHEEESNVYRVLLHTEDEAFVQEIWAGSPAALAPALKSEITHVEHAARILKSGFGENAYIKVGNHNFVETGLYWCDDELFEILKIDLLNGNRTDLDRPNTVALSKRTAEQYYGTVDPIGKTLKLDNRINLEVVAVYKNFPQNSSFDFNAIASFSTLPFYKDQSWSNASFETLVQFEKGISVPSTEQQLQQLVDKNVDKEDQWYSFSLQPLEKIHLYSAGFSDSFAARIGDINEIKNLSLLAILILCIACINYMNLTTARSQKRSKEVGINKTLGASKGSLVTQFYTETALLTLISMGIGVLMAALALPWFNQLTGQDLNQSMFLDPASVLAFIVIWVVTTGIAGSYPALYLSGYSPKSALSPSLKQDSSTILIRKGLVVLQFSASVILIVGILVVYQQIQFIRNQNLGFEPENVIAVSAASINEENDRTALIQEFKGISQVTAAAMAQGFPGMGVSLNSIYKNDDDKRGLDIQTNMADSDILNVLGLRLLAGTSLPKIKQENDTLIEIVLNKKAVDYLGFTPEEAINKQVYINRKSTIVGVVDNFNFASLHEPIGAYAFTNRRTEPKSFVLVRFTGFSQDLLKHLEAVFKKVAPGSVFDYSFLDKNIEKLYEREQRTARVGIFFCALAIFVACLGLFGLAAFMAEQRKKEIGIRKVLGASILGITQMLSREFIKLVLLALVIAFPIAFWLTNRWLQGFAFKITIGWWVFAIAGLTAILIALFTVSFQSVRAALSNPVKSLQSE